MVLIGSARSNEFGKLEGGQPGDQKHGEEVSTQAWYLHEKGWYVIRAKSPVMANKIAYDVKAGCDNPYVGYSYWDHCYTLYNEAAKYKFDYAKVKIPCETNCAKFILGAAKYAGSKVQDFYTGDAVEKFRKTGEFDILTADKYCKSSDYLRKGDLLVTRTQGHIVCVLEDGPLVNVGTPYRVWNCFAANIRAGDSVNDAILVKDGLKSGTLVNLLDWSASGWGLVLYGDLQGYIAPMYLQELPKANIAGDTWLRDKAGKDIGKQIIVVEKGSVVHLTGKTSKVGNTTWYEIIHKTYTGWSSGLYVKPIK